MTARPTPLRVGFHLLDRQIVDRDSAPVGKVDDVELKIGPDGRLRVAALLCGLGVLGERMQGWAGRLMTRSSRVLSRDRSHVALRIPWDQVDRVESAIVLTVARELLPDPALERWLSDNVISKIPGAGHAG